MDDFKHFTIENKDGIIGNESSKTAIGALQAYLGRKLRTFTVQIDSSNNKCLINIHDKDSDVNYTVSEVLEEK